MMVVGPCKRSDTRSPAFLMELRGLVYGRAVYRLRMTLKSQ